MMPARNKIENLHGWGKLMSEKDLEEVLAARKAWEKEPAAKRKLLAQSLVLNIEDVDREFRSLRASREKKTREEEEATKKEASEKRIGTEKVELPVKPKYTERVSRPAAPPKAAIAPTLINQNPNCGPGCGSDQLHPDRKCPELWRLAAKQKEKRKAEASPDGLVREKKYGRYQLCEGDWQCGCCYFWNVKLHSRCRGKNPAALGECEATRDGEEYSHKVQAHAPGVPSRVGGRFQGDWYCAKCYWWNRWYWSGCGKCGEHEADVGEYNDNDKSLPEAPMTASTHAPNDWGPDNQKLVDQSDYDRRGRKYATVPHK